MASLLSPGGSPSQKLMHKSRDLRSRDAKLGNMFGDSDVQPAAYDTAAVGLEQFGGMANPEIPRDKKTGPNQLYWLQLFAYI